MNILEKIKENVSKVIVGKEGVIDLAMIALVANGHVLLEDVPETGKTTLAKTLAKSIDGAF
ncbi:magnesium chelatase [Bacillus toyonensis]|nr:Magnesium chelatase, ChlI subunit [Bacillus cereus Rock3-28]OSM14909.1 magnesium chelatase [Bacillus toyonensis]UKS61288.1 MoxR family ATPase [Bacillus toyonensis]